MNILEDDNIDNAISVFRSDRQFIDNNSSGIPPRPTPARQPTTTESAAGVVDRSGQRHSPITSGLVARRWQNAKLDILAPRRTGSRSRAARDDSKKPTNGRGGGRSLGSRQNLMLSAVDAEGETSNNPAVIAYNAVLILFDVLVFLVKSVYITVKAIVEMAMLPPARDVSGDIVLITGAGHGMGKNLALQYAALGTTVVCVDVNEKTNSETVAAIKSAKGGKAFGFTCDVTNRQQVMDTCKKIKEQVGVVSILINNAGIMPTHSLLQQTETEIRKTFDINVLAHFWFIQSLLPDMLKQNRGHIVVLSSIAGMIGFKYLVPYCGTKFAVRGIMEALSEELRADPTKPNIKFTTIYPYMVDTGLCKRPYTRFPSLLKMVKPDDAAAAIIDAQRRGLTEASIPKYLLYLNTWFRNLPLRVGQEFGDLLDTGLQSDL
ncbi:short-chain dehydrogenase [Anopheles darlingi]|uniref:Short-chain dehydrogenase/reductase 3 n=1 Tax=Anopheles darlingi TaxID=43151 RepID=W5JLG6_ANODA|nr:short-chain dehydrogenase [Anopheles darlingi]